MTEQNIWKGLLKFEWYKQVDTESMIPTSESITRITSLSMKKEDEKYRCSFPANTGKSTP